MEIKLSTNGDVDAMMGINPEIMNDGHTFVHLGTHATGSNLLGSTEQLCDRESHGYIKHA